MPAPPNESDIYHAIEHGPEIDSPAVRRAHSRLRAACARRTEEPTPESEAAVYDALRRYQEAVERAANARSSSR